MSQDSVTQSDIKLLRDQIDQLQIDAAAPKTPWYRQRPSLLSLIALIFSILSFAITQQKASLQEVRSKKDELRKLLIELVAFQDSFTTIAVIADPMKREAASALLNTKRGIYLQTAESLADELDNMISSSEYAALGREKMAQSDFSKAEHYFVKAPNAAKDLISKATATRDLGMFYFQSMPLKNLDRARKNFSISVDLSKASTDDYSNYTTGYTYETWAFMEKANGFLTDGNAKIEIAREYYRKILPPNTLGQWASESLEKRIVAFPH